MRRLKATMILGAFLCAGMLMAAAQTPDGEPQGGPQGGYGQHHRMSPEQELNHLAKALNLSADQQAQIKPILAERMQQMEGVRADSSLAPQDRRAKMRQIQQDSRAKLEAVLNDQQKQQYEQMEQRRWNGRHRGGEQPDNAPSDNPPPQ